MPFDPHDPDVELLMFEQSVAQSEAHHAAGRVMNDGHGGLRSVPPRHADRIEVGLLRHNHQAQVDSVRMWDRMRMAAAGGPPPDPPGGEPVPVDGGEWGCVDDWLPSTYATKILDFMARMVKASDAVGRTVSTAAADVADRFAALGGRIARLGLPWQHLTDRVGVPAPTRPAWLPDPFADLFVIPPPPAFTNLSLAAWSTPGLTPAFSAHLRVGDGRWRIVDDVDITGSDSYTSADYYPSDAFVDIIGVAGPGRLVLEPVGGPTVDTARQFAGGRVTADWSSVSMFDTATGTWQPTAGVAASRLRVHDDNGDPIPGASLFVHDGHDHPIDIDIGGP